MKSKFVFNDQRILDEFCNSKCKYCSGFYPSEFSLTFNEDQTLKMPDCWKAKIMNNKELSKRIPLSPKISDFFNLGKTVLNETDKIMDYKILKISGGEIFLYSDLVDFIKSINKDYTAIQLLTNAMAVTPEKIKQLAKLGNVYFQVSLDGIDGNTNFARNSNDLVVKRILENITCILENGMGLEINCVLTKHNTGSFKKVLEYFKDFKNLVIVPRPVRGEPRSILDFDKKQISDFKKIVIDEYDNYKSILPPKKYIERLIFVMENGYRGINCYVPFYVIGSDNYGNINTCTRADDLPLIGNVFTDPMKIKKTFENHKNYSPDSRPGPCSYCIIQYEMMNLYTEGLIDKKEMQKIPSFKIPGVMDRIDEIKKNLIDSGLVK
jgi:MoaA/NifB/PqqE/SkfB family radical SAM enzyme